MNKTILAFDTNIWIYLTKPPFNDILDSLIKEVNYGTLEIMVNDIIKAEWDRNRENTVRSLSEAIKQEYNSAVKLLPFIDNQSDQLKYNDILAKYNKQEERIKSAENKVKCVEDFMNNCTIIKVSDLQKLFVAELAINKKFPFEKNKNNFNDALIIRNLAETINERIKMQGSSLPFKYDLIYVSNNPQDFIDSKTNKIHSDILTDCDNLSVINVKELGHALKIKNDLIEDFDAWLEYMVSTHAEMEAEITRGK